MPTLRLGSGQRKTTQRYRRVVGVLVRHGFGYALAELGLGFLMPFQRGLLGHKRRPAPYLRGEHLRLAFEELGTVAIKLGQILSTRSDLLPPDIVAELSKLQRSVPPEPPDVVEAVIAQELGALVSTLFACFDPQPLGSASIGEVHAARLHTGEEVVVKVQRSSLESLVEDDLNILRDLARLAQARTQWGKVYDLPAIVEEFADTLREELDYTREGRNADRIRRNFAGNPSLYVPKIYWEYSAPRVLTMERLHGIAINDLPTLDEAHIDRRHMAESVLRIILKMVLEDGFFHADPHPGNFFVLPDGAIGLVDYGMVGRLDEGTRERLVVLVMALVKEDLDRLIDEMSGLGIVASVPQRARLKRDLDHLISRYWGAPLQEIRIGQMLEAFLAVARRNQLTVPTGLTLMSKTLAMEESLARDLSPDVNPADLLTAVVRQRTLRNALPQDWQERLGPALYDAVFLARHLPRRIDRALSMVEQGSLSTEMRLRDIEHVLGALQRLVNRLVLGILSAGLIVGVALLLQVLHLQDLQWLLQVLLWTGLGAVLVTTTWLALHILRGQ